MFKQSRREQKLTKRVADLESQLAAKDRNIAVMQAEIDAMAAVIARDRQRVQAESAGYARQRAEYEGSNGQPSQSI